MEKITRNKALSIGLKKYFTGERCPLGHLSPRLCSNYTCYECLKLKYSKYVADNKLSVARYKKEWTEKNRDSNRKSGKKWSASNKLAIRAKNAKRRTLKLKASPSWANVKAIKEIYLLCPKGMVVDHIIPLQGKNVCGLHVENNLQYLTKSENSSKGNRFIGELKYA